MRKLSLAAILTSVVSLFTSLLIAVPAAHAQDEVDTPNNPGISGLEVAITALKPLDPQPKKNLVVNGTVTNRSQATINNIVIRIQIGQSPVTSVQVVADLDSNTSIASTRSLPGGEIMQQLGNSGGLAPGGVSPFTFDIPFADFSMPGSGIYPLQIQAIDFDNSAHSGFTQTFLPWYPRKGDYTPINVLMYWPLATIPNKTSTTLLMNDSTPTSVDTGGRLDKLISVPGSKEAVSWIVDPSLIQTVGATQTGYDYLNDEGQQVRGTRSEATENWLNRVKGTLRDANVQSMPYANSDLTALVANRLRTNASQSVRTAAPTLSTDLGTKVDQTVTWAPLERLTPEALGVSIRSGSPYVVLPTTSLTSNFDFGRPRNPVTQVTTDREPATALLADTELSAAFAQEAATATDEVRLRQRIIALIGAWPRSQNQTSVVVAPPTLWSPNAKVLRQVLHTLQLAKWARASTPTRVLRAHEPEDQHELAEPSENATSSRGTTSYFEGILAAQRSLRQFDSVLRTPTDFTNPVRSALLRAESSAWLGNRRNGRALLRTINEQINQGTDKVRAVASEVVSVSGDSGSIPITLVNDFDQPATVKVRLEATPSVRLEVGSETETEHKIPARRKISVELPIEVVGSEDLPVTVQLLTPTGQRWGTGEQISVRSSAYARAATWVVIAAFALLVGLLAVNSIRRRRSAKAEKAEGGTADALNSTGEPGSDPNNIHQLDHWRGPRD